MTYLKRGLSLFLSSLVLGNFLNFQVPFSVVADSDIARESEILEKGSEREGNTEEDSKDTEDLADTKNLESLELEEKSNIENVSTRNIRGVIETYNSDLGNQETCGDFVVHSETSTGYSYENGVLKFSSGGEYEISMAGDVTQISQRI